jgi:hypothetical protein
MPLIEHNKFSIDLIDNNFISLVIKEGETIEAEDIHEIYAGYKLLVGENDYVVAVYANPFSSMSKKAREIAANEYSSPKRKKVALISNNLSHVIIVSFFINVNRPKTSIKIFKNEADAHAWLRT